ncbi:MAG TPA: HEAT repeat domain-containing protein [Thermodesulfovibrionales bacterium]|nr:HEAT repeat domain-containing protein [Thermodesulfovibrionales bacterium]
MPDNVDIKSMIAEYMEKGFLENIIDMFKHDKSLYPLIGELMADERMRVRLGMSALVEALVKEDADNIARSIPSLATLLKDRNPTLRGDAVYLLGIIGQNEVIPLLAEAAGDDNPEVRQIAREAMEEIKMRKATSP